MNTSTSDLGQTIAQLITAGRATLAQRAMAAEELAVLAGEDAERELHAKWASRLETLRERLPVWAQEYLAMPTYEPERKEGNYDYGYRDEYAGIALEIYGLAPILIYVGKEHLRFAPCPPQLYFDEEMGMWLADYRREIWRSQYAVPNETDFAAAIAVAEQYAKECWRLHIAAEERNNEPKQLPAPDPALYSIDQARAALGQGEYAEAQALAMLAVAEELSSIKAALRSA